MKTTVLLIAISLTAACSKPASSPAPTTTAPTSSQAPANDAVAMKLVEDSGSGATNCGRFDVKATSDQLKAGSDCAMQSSQGKKAFFVAYDMPGMSVGVAGNSSGKLFTVQSQGAGAVTSGDCPAQLRVASSGRVTCFAPGDMGSMSGSHTAGSVPSGMPNPHAGSTKAPANK